MCGRGKQEVAPVVSALRDWIDQDRTLTPAILGALAQLPIDESGRKWALQCGCDALSIVDEEDVPVVAASIISFTCPCDARMVLDALSQQTLVHTLRPLLLESLNDAIRSRPGLGRTIMDQAGSESWIEVALQAVLRSAGSGFDLVSLIEQSDLPNEPKRQSSEGTFVASSVFAKKFKSVDAIVEAAQALAACDSFATRSLCELFAWTADHCKPALVPVATVALRVPKVGPLIVGQLLADSVADRNGALYALEQLGDVLVPYGHLVEEALSRSSVLPMTVVASLSIAASRACTPQPILIVIQKLLFTNSPCAAAALLGPLIKSGRLDREDSVAAAGWLLGAVKLTRSRLNDTPDPAIAIAWALSDGANVLKGSVPPPDISWMIHENSFAWDLLPGNQRVRADMVLPIALIRCYIALSSEDALDYFVDAVLSTQSQANTQGYAIAIGLLCEWTEHGHGSDVLPDRIERLLSCAAVWRQKLKQTAYLSRFVPPLPIVIAIRLMTFRDVAVQEWAVERLVAVLHGDDAVVPRSASSDVLCTVPYILSQVVDGGLFNSVSASLLPLVSACIGSYSGLCRSVPLPSSYSERLSTFLREECTKEASDAVAGLIQCGLGHNPERRSLVIATRRSIDPPCWSRFEPLWRVLDTNGRVLLAKHVCEALVDPSSEWKIQQDQRTEWFDTAVKLAKGALAASPIDTIAPMFEAWKCIAHAATDAIEKGENGHWFSLQGAVPSLWNALTEATQKGFDDTRPSLIRVCSAGDSIATSLDLIAVSVNRGKSNESSETRNRRVLKINRRASEFREKIASLREAYDIDTMIGVGVDDGLLEYLTDKTALPEAVEIEEEEEETEADWLDELADESAIGYSVVMH